MMRASGHVIAMASAMKKVAAPRSRFNRTACYIFAAMPPAIPFTGNYEDLSTDRGYQFKFYCEKCHNGYMSSFQNSTVGMIGSAARVAGSLFGGVFGNVANSAYEVQRAVGGPAHDTALKTAVTEIAPTVKQCTRCGNWVW